MSRIVFCFLICLVETGGSSSMNQNTEGPGVSTANGKVRGTVHYAMNSSKPVYAFYSIPYAEPPIGSNRLQPPRPLKPWTGVKDSTKIGHYCIQDYETWNKVVSLLKLPLQEPSESTPYSEDCLELDIYTPDINAKLPVMFWIHGGGLNAGTGHSYNGTALSTFNNVVVVSINYRLNYFGFLSTGDDKIPGNMGFMDQVEALKWVKHNIYAFGGDPDAVTIFGESAGSWSTSSHLVSPMSKGLFKYAILQSGSIFSDILVNEKPENVFDELALLLGCANGSKSEIVECVQKSSVKDIHQAIKEKIGFTKYDMVTVDGEFFPKHPKYLYEEADFSDTVIMVGTTEHEMYVCLGFWSFEGEYNYGTFLEEIKHANELFCQQDTVTVENLNKIAKFYLDKDISEMDEKAYRDKAMEITTDFTMEFPVLNLTNTFVERGGTAFLYIYSHSPSHMATIRPRDYGAHGDELVFLFGAGLLEPNEYDEQFTYSETEKSFALQLMKYWVNFASNGDPNGEGLPTWPKYNFENEDYVILKPQPYVRQLFRKEKFEFWKEFMQGIEQKRHVTKLTRDEL